MSGTFTGVGVGPGEPELMTLKAVRVIRESDVIAVPVSDGTLEGPVRESRYQSESGKTCGEYLSRCVAYQIVCSALPEVEKKEKLFLPMPMIKEKERLSNIHDRDAEAVAELLEAGKNVVFLTLGDPTVYSTCMYVHKRLKRTGYPTALVPGVPSFCAAAARMDMALTENREELHVLPASYDIEESLHLPGTKILMKAGRKMGQVKELLLENEIEAKMVENCGMKDERIYPDVREIPEQAGYYSLLVVKENKKGGRQG